jgi:predicted DNA-binding transcriptional regulator YafY
MRIDRMLAIVVLLLNRKCITANDLAERFEVSQRTIYRDIDAINEAGIPVMSTRGSTGGFSIVENYRLNHQYLSLENSRAIISALKGVNTALQDRDIELTMEKIRSLIPVEKAPELDGQMDRFVIDHLPWGYNKKMQNRIRQINTAITDCKRIRLVYRNLKGENSERKIEPMTLLFKGYSWYVFGFCLTKQAGRVFRLSRIRELETLGEVFLRRDIHFSDFAVKVDQGVKMVDLELKFTPAVKMRVQEFFYMEDILENEDGSVTVKVSFPEDNWVYSFIMSYGSDVEVISPEHIRELILNSAKKTLSIYQT